jgi:hypothetical protein
MEKGLGGILESSRQQHFVVVLLAHAHPNAYVSCSLILKLPPSYHTTCPLLLIKFNQLISTSPKPSGGLLWEPLPGCHRSLKILPHTALLPAGSS